MTDEQAAAAIQAVVDEIKQGRYGSDYEVEHGKADDVLLQALSEQGYTKTVALWRELSAHWWWA